MKKNIPANAFKLTIGEFELAENGENAKSAPVRLLARTGQPISHWYWGQIVHDLEGMKLHKNRLPIDWNHTDKLIGYLNKFPIEDWNLYCYGALTPYKDDDKASEIIFLAKAGVPYEASINFGGEGIKLEVLSEGQVATVNGYQLEGPATIVREWPLRGVAICPYGADQNTNTELNSGQEIAVEYIDNVNIGDQSMNENEKVEESVELSQEGGKVTDDQDTQAEELEAQAEETVEAEVAEESEVVEQETTEETVEAKEEVKLSAPGQKYMDTFGIEKGALYFAQGLSFEDATANHLSWQQERIEQLESSLATNRGTAPVEFSTSNFSGNDVKKTGILPFNSNRT